MTPELRDLLDRLYQEGLAHDAAEPDRLRRLRNLEPDAAALLWITLRALRPRLVVEIGTSNGYSTLWLADAVAAAGGRLVSVDIDAAIQARAAAHLAEAGLAGVVELVTGDAGEYLAGLPDGAVDVLFLDAERTEYLGWWPHPLRVLRPGGLLAMDNVLSHPDEVADVRALLETDPTVASTVVDIGKGELLAVTAT
ncbi:MAG: O-methyltransferase [Mycobacteriales bacterium]